MDERVYRLVMSRPIPDKLIRNLARAPLVETFAIRRHVGQKLTPTLLETLPLVCQGHSDRRIGELRHFSEDAIKDHVKRLVAIFQARNRTHLAAIAVELGYVSVIARAR